jgi:hypothetical protein
VCEAVHSAASALYACLDLGQVLDEVGRALTHVSPLVRVECAKFLRQVFETAPTHPDKATAYVSALVRCVPQLLGSIRDRGNVFRIDSINRNFLDKFLS